MQIDCYGFPATSEFFRRRRLDTYLFKNAGGTLYECFGRGAKRPIHRIDRTAEGELRVMWAWGEWAKADRLAYVPLSETLEVEDAE